MELKQISTDKILVNFYQPRTKFDREKIKELGESILSNGLINPITVRKWKDKFMIVSGERRWQAHKIAGIKKIDVFVKEYKTQGQFMVESLIENLHREDLSPQEASKFAKRIMKEEKIKNTFQLSKRLSISQTTVDNWFDFDKLKEKLPVQVREKVSPTVIYETRGLPEKERIELIKDAVREDFGGSKMRQIVSERKQNPIPEPLSYEENANDKSMEILKDFSNMTHHINELKQMNIHDIKKSMADRMLTSLGVLIYKTFPKLYGVLKERGAKPDIRIKKLLEK